MSGGCGMKWDVGGVNGGKIPPAPILTRIIIVVITGP
jgi:hypothetical protein